MTFRLRKVAVLGSGVMGTGIAAQLANVGLEVIMLDILPFDLKEDEKSNPKARNRTADSSLAKAMKSKPAAFYKKAFAKRITTGNFDDDFEKISDCDWIIEVVIEHLDIKRNIFEKVDRLRKKGSLVSSNTSSIPIHLLAEGRSDEFKAHFCGTHFFNPPRYLRLLEIIPTNETRKEVVDFFMQFGDVNLGKQTVLCKDTPGFIANRIGVFSGSKMYQLTDKFGLTIEEVDRLAGPAIGRPKTGHFRLQDLVGIDVGEKVSKVIINSCPNDEFVKKHKDDPTPPYLKFLLENKFLGDKTGYGFYKKTDDRDASGKRVILSLDLKTNEYRPAIKPNLESLKASKKIQLMPKRLKALIEAEDSGGKFLREYFGSLFAYVSNRVPEISDEIYAVDDAMKAGYAWDFGPFEYWDMIGLENGIQLAQENGEPVATWITEMAAKGISHFYNQAEGEQQYYNRSAQKYQSTPGVKEYIILDHHRSKSPVIKNAECTVHDIGDGVLCVEFQTKANAIGEGIGRGLVEAVELAESDGWNGVVIGNNAKNFTVGANLMAVGMLAMQQQFDTLEQMTNGFQQVNMKLRYSSVPVVVATQGYVFGGGCEITMHCDAACSAAESYIGLVEVGVGLLPGGGGTKEMALRASDKFFEGDVQIPTLIEHFKPVAMATVATSADEAFDLGLLQKHRDQVVYNGSRNIAEAKKKVLQLAENYIQPVKRDDITVLGRGGLATLYTAINEFYLGKYMSEYDVEIARKIAYVFCGGDLTGQQKVNEQYLLDIEREGFLSLLGNQKTLERIQYMLQFNKPLRN